MEDFAVSQGLDHFRGDETLCDVTLVPGDSSETFPVHRVIMASASDYFKAMFTGESHQTRGGYILLSKLITVVVLFLYVVLHTSKIMIHFIFVPYWLSVKMFYLV